MNAFDAQLLQEIRARFHHVERCPYQGPRIFFENAGGSLTLKSVVEVAAKLAAIPDNQGRDNPASAEMGRLIARGREDMATFLGVGGDGDG
ncbi:MAG: nitrogen fixation protein NifS, partial [Gammaproteobacteria bacterium]|nr:nitrogen fixation protein NifS [Gammaproteobacteria bacterium]